MRTLRTAAHVHSDWSYDGSWTLTKVSRTLGRIGFDAVLMAEHDRGFDEDRWRAYQRACERASTDGALLVPGIEYSDPDNVVHLLVWGDLPFLGEGRDSDALIHDAHAAGAVIVWAHPGRGNAVLSPSSVALLDGAEALNRKYDGFDLGVAASKLLASHTHLAGWVGLDLHDGRQLFPLAMRLAVAEPSVSSILLALQQGDAEGRICGLPVSSLRAGPAKACLSLAEKTRSRVAPRLRPVWRRLT